MILYVPYLFRALIIRVCAYMSQCGLHERIANVMYYEPGFIVRKVRRAFTHPFFSSTVWISSLSPKSFERSSFALLSVGSNIPQGTVLDPRSPPSSEGGSSTSGVGSPLRIRRYHVPTCRLVLCMQRAFNSVMGKDSQL